MPITHYPFSEQKHAYWRWWQDTSTEFGRKNKIRGRASSFMDDKSPNSRKYSIASKTTHTRLSATKIYFHYVRIRIICVEPSYMVTIMRTISRAHGNRCRFPTRFLSVFLLDHDEWAWWKDFFCQCLRVSRPICVHDHLELWKWYPLEAKVMVCRPNASYIPYIARDLFYRPNAHSFWSFAISLEVGILFIVTKYVRIYSCASDIIVSNLHLHLGKWHLRNSCLILWIPPKRIAFGDGFVVHALRTHTFIMWGVLPGLPIHGLHALIETCTRCAEDTFIQIGLLCVCRADGCRMHALASRRGRSATSMQKSLFMVLFYYWRSASSRCARTISAIRAGKMCDRDFILS